MNFLRTCSLVLLLVLPQTIPPALAFVVVHVAKPRNPQCTSGNKISPSSLSLGGSGRSSRVQVQTSSRVLLRANLFDWLNPSPPPGKKKNQQEQPQQQGADNCKESSPKDTSHHKAASTPVVADFLAQWFQTNTPPIPAPTKHDDEPSNVPIQAKETTEHVEATTTFLEDDEAVSTVSLLDEQQDHKASLLQGIATTPATPATTIADIPHRVEATSTTTPTTPTPTSTIHKGRVLWFNPQRGYGFLIPEDETTDDQTMDHPQDPIFVHNSAIDLSQGYFRTLMRSECVEYQVDVDSQGRRIATHVTGPHGKPVKSIQQQQLDGPPKKGTPPSPQ